MSELSGNKLLKIRLHFWNGNFGETDPRYFANYTVIRILVHSVLCYVVSLVNGARCKTICALHGTQLPSHRVNAPSR